VKKIKTMKFKKSQQMLQILKISGKKLKPFIAMIARYCELF